MSISAYGDRHTLYETAMLVACRVHAVIAGQILA